MIEDKLKRMVVNVSEKSHAELVIALKLDDFVSQSDFFRTIINCYLDKDPLFLDFIDSIKIKRSARNKKINKRNRQLLKEGEELLKDFSLNPDEIENIFDILEENNIDI